MQYFQQSSVNNLQKPTTIEAPILTNFTIIHFIHYTR